MARVVFKFPEPEDPQWPEGAVRRALWRTIKQSVPGLPSLPKASGRLVVLAGLGLSVWAWGLPHVRVDRQMHSYGQNLVYGSCTYWGWETFRSSGSDCPWVKWRKF